MKSLLSILTIGALAATIASCNKTDDKTTVCRITSIINSQQNQVNSSTKIVYDEGRIASILTTGVSGGIKTFTYGVGTITVVEKDNNGKLQRTKYLVLTPDNKIASLTEKNAANVTEDVTYYYYDGDNHLNRIVNTASNGLTDTTMVTFIDGNMTNTVNNTTKAVTSYIYDDNKLFMDGDYLQIMQTLDNGGLAVINKSVLKSMVTNNGTPTNIQYEYNSLGKITKMIVSGAIADEYSYEYFCD